MNTNNIKWRYAEKGMSPWITLLIVFLIVVIAWISFQFIAINYRKYEIIKRADEKIKFEYDNEVIRDNMIKYLKSKGIEIHPDEITIARQGTDIGDSVMINFAYTDSCRLLGNLIKADWNIVFVFNYDIELKNILHQAELRH